MGATNEFNKMEGTRYNRLHPNFVYMAMSTVAGGMSDLEGDIQVTRNDCGIVYALHLDEDMNIDRMDPVVAGKPYVDENGRTKCDEEYIANPDNILVLNDGRVIIGEDTSKHTNNMAWIWQGGYIPKLEETAEETPEMPVEEEEHVEEVEANLGDVLEKLASFFTSGNLNIDRITLSSK